MQQAWPLGIQQTKEKEHNCLQIKLRGNPWWSSDGAQVCASRMLACALLSAMDAHGYELVGSVDMSAGSGDNAGDCECFIRQRDQDGWLIGSGLVVLRR